jgi:predicted adenine nucleotide alpha hydrolase (AANH) superfamily ATPase
MRILLHLCCANCTIIPLDDLRRQGHSVTGFFYNPNIHPYQEFVRRRDTVRHYAELTELPMIWGDDYDLDAFLAAVAPAPAMRCDHCYRVRLQATAAAAISGGFDGFSATLLYSRYQQHEAIRTFGEALAADQGLAFVYADWRQGWQEGIRRSKELGLYRQQYCGCIYSERDRYHPREQKSQ